MSGNPVEVTLTAEECADVMKELGEKLKDMRQAFKKIDDEKILATWMSNPGGKPGTSQVMYSCGDKLGGDHKDVTYGDFCAGLRAIREVLQEIETRICGYVNQNEVLISKK
jgi:hypothetical protein